MKLRMTSVKYRCKKCGYSEPFKKWELGLVSFVHALILLFCMLGFIFVIVLSLTGLDPILGSITDANYVSVNRAQDSQLRDIAVNMTRMCDGDDADCYARAIYTHMAGTRYIPDSINGNHTYDPLTVLRDGSDCKGLANAYRALLNSVGIRASIVTNLKYRHAVAVVPRYRFGEKLPGFYVIDLTVPSATRMADGEDVWSYQDDGHVRMGW